MPTFIIVQCFRCHTYQCRQDAQTRKFSCVICNEKQSVQRIFGSSEKAQTLTPIVKEKNLNRTDEQLAWTKNDTSNDPIPASQRFQQTQERYRERVQAKSLYKGTAVGMWDQFVEKKQGSCEAQSEPPYSAQNSHSFANLHSISTQGLITLPSSSTQQPTKDATFTSASRYANSASHPPRMNTNSDTANQPTGSTSKFSSRDRDRNYSTASTSLASNNPANTSQTLSFSLPAKSSAKTRGLYGKRSQNNASPNIIFKPKATEMKETSAPVDDQSSSTFQLPMGNRAASGHSESSDLSILNSRTQFSNPIIPHRIHPQVESSPQYDAAHTDLTNLDEQHTSPSFSNPYLSSNESKTPKFFVSQQSQPQHQQPPATNLPTTNLATANPTTKKPSKWDAFK